MQKKIISLSKSPKQFEKTVTKQSENPVPSFNIFALLPLFSLFGSKLAGEIGQLITMFHDSKSTPEEKIELAVKIIPQFVNLVRRNPEKIEPLLLAAGITPGILLFAHAIDTVHDTFKHAKTLGLFNDIETKDVIPALILFVASPTQATDMSKPNRNLLSPIYKKLVSSLGQQHKSTQYSEIMGELKKILVDLIFPKLLAAYIKNFPKLLNTIDLVKKAENNSRLQYIAIGKFVQCSFKISENSKMLDLTAICKELNQAAYTHLANLINTYDPKSTALKVPEGCDGTLFLNAYRRTVAMQAAKFEDEIEELSLMSKTMQKLFLKFSSIQNHNKTIWNCTPDAAPYLPFFWEKAKAMYASEEALDGTKTKVVLNLRLEIKKQEKRLSDCLEKPLKNEKTIKGLKKKIKYLKTAAYWSASNKLPESILNLMTVDNVFGSMIAIRKAGITMSLSNKFHINDLLAAYNKDKKDVTVYVTTKGTVYYKSRNPTLWPWCYVNCVNTTQQFIKTKLLTENLLQELTTLKIKAIMVNVLIDDMAENIKKMFPFECLSKYVLSTIIEPSEEKFILAETLLEFSCKQKNTNYYDDYKVYLELAMGTWKAFILELENFVGKKNYLSLSMQLKRDYEYILNAMRISGEMNAKVGEIGKYNSANVGKLLGFNMNIMAFETMDEMLYQKLEGKSLPIRKTKGRKSHYENGYLTHFKTSSKWPNSSCLSYIKPPEKMGLKPFENHGHPRYDHYRYAILGRIQYMGQAGNDLATYLRELLEGDPVNSVFMSATKINEKIIDEFQELKKLICNYKDCCEKKRSLITDNEKEKKWKEKIAKLEEARDQSLYPAFETDTFINAGIIYWENWSPHREKNNNENKIDPKLANKMFYVGLQALKIQKMIESGGAVIEAFEKIERARRSILSWIKDDDVSDLTNTFKPLELIEAIDYLIFTYLIYKTEL